MANNRFQEGVESGKERSLTQLHMLEEYYAEKEVQLSEVGDWHGAYEAQMWKNAY